jgi:hypothetical protein
VYNFILQYDVIHDALEVICYKNLKRPRNFGDIASYGNILALAGIKLKFVKLRRFFGDIGKLGDIEPPCKQVKRYGLRLVP